MSTATTRVVRTAVVVGTRSGLDLRRAAIAGSVIGGYIALGLAFRLSADAYLLAGIPITLAFQARIARRPVRALWLRSAPAFAVTRRSVATGVVLGIAPAVMVITGIRAGDPVRVAYGLASLVGAAAAGYAVGALDRAAVRTSLRASAAGSAVMVGVMVGYRLATGGVAGEVAQALATVAVSLATYLPAVFVLEEVLFRGAIDAYLAGGDAPGHHAGRASAIYGSALWGLWHLPVAGLGLGVLTVPYLLVIHVLLGWILVRAWRQTGNLAAPGIAHAAIDALRNGVAAL